MNTELILAAGLSRGLRMQDAYDITLGMWIDYIIECNNMADEEADDSREATQIDFDRF